MGLGFLYKLKTKLTCAGSLITFNEEDYHYYEENERVTRPIEKTLAKLYGTTKETRRESFNSCLPSLVKNIIFCYERKLLKNANIENKQRET